MRRILVLGAYAPSLVNFRGPLLQRLVHSGYDVHAAASEMTDEIRADLRAMSVTTHEIPFSRTSMNPVTDFKSLFRLWGLLDRIRPDLVLTYTIKPNVWGAFAASLSGARSVAMVTGLGYAFTNTGGNTVKTRLVRAAARFLYRHATDRNWRVIFQNPNDRDDFIAAGCLTNTTKYRMIDGSGVDLGYYTPAPLPDTPDFLMISRILGAKGVREYAQAALKVKRTHPHARFRLVGFFDSGPDAVSRAEVDAWISGGIEYLGPSDDVRPHLAACRFYVLPSYREGMPRSVLEAMAVGRAILTSDAPGCRETVVDGVNGFLVPVRDVAALAEKMRWMIDNPLACDRMAGESLCIVRKKYDVEKVNEALMQHLELEE